MVALRPYQTDTLAELRRLAGSGMRRLLVSWATGVGKTVLAAEICRRANGHVLFIAHRTELLTQAADKIRRANPEADIGVVRRDQNEWDHHIVVASIQTLSRTKRLEQIPRDRFTVLFVDEAHHGVANTYKRVIDYFGEAIVIGLSATCYRMAGDLSDVFPDGPCVTYGIQVAVADGYLAPPRQWRVELDCDLTGVKSVGGDFAVGDLADAVNTAAHNKLIVESWQERAADRSTVAFTVNVKHAIDLAEAFRAAGVAAEHVDGGFSEDDREAVLARFESGETRVVTNCMILTEGYDFDGIGCIVMARPTRSRGLYVQAIGRGLRPAEGKADCTILDVVGVSRRHKLAGLPAVFDIDEDDLAGETPEEWEAGANERLAAIGPARLEWSTREIDPFELDIVVNFSPSAEWHFRPATDAQMEYLRKLGAAVSGGLRKGEASALIEALKYRCENEPATRNQRGFLGWHGHERAADPGLTKGSAYVLIAAIKKAAA